MNHADINITFIQEKPMLTDNDIKPGARLVFLGTVEEVTDGAVYVRFDGSDPDAIVPTVMDWDEVLSASMYPTARPE